MALTPSDERGRALDRVITFSDGVFAIAITLLVLNFKLPTLSSHNTNAQLFDALADQWGTFLGFALSFWVIARYWIAHHRLSIMLRQVDSTFITLNLMLLASVVFLPFPTETVGLYGSTTTAVVFYATSMTITGLLSTAVWQYALSRGLMDERLNASARRVTLLRGLSVPLVFASSIPIAFADTSAARYWWILLAAQVGIRRWAPDANEPPASPAGAG